MNSSSASSQSTSAAIGVDLASGGLTGNASYGKGTEQTDGVTQINTHVVGSGFSGVPKNSALEKGTLIDRYGSTIGRFFAPFGTPFEQRALPASSAYGPYTFLIVLKPLPVLSGPSASWFDQPDGGVQFKTKLSVQELIDGNFIEIYNR